MNGTAALILQALHPYHLKGEGENKFRCDSPLRPGSNSLAFTLTIDDDEHGAYFDHVNGDKGSLYELAEKLNIPVERKAVAETKRGYKNLAEYAEAHGLTAETLIKNGWSDVQTYQDRPALTFKTATGVRYRFIDGEKPYYKSENGYKACWYALKRAIQHAQETHQPLVICNGEISTLKAQEVGLAACCVTAGEKALPNALIAELLQQWKGEIILAYDCDETGQKTAQAVRDQLAERHPVIVDLGFTKGGDLADFCMLFGEQSAAELVKRTVVQPIAAPVKSDAASLADGLRELQDAIRADEKLKQTLDMDVLLSKVQAEIDRIKMSSAKPIIMSFSDIIHDNREQLKARLENPSLIQGLRSNIPSLDKAVGGFDAEIYVILGATSMGKSTLAVSIAREFQRQAPGFVAPTESDPRRWMNKLVASLLRIPSDKIETGMLTPEEQKRVFKEYDYLESAGCHMVKHGAPTISLIRAALLYGIKEYGYEWCIIDSISKMRHPGTSTIYDRMSSVNDGLQELVQETNIPFIVTSQVGRDVGARSAGQKMPTIDDAYGSGVIEHNAGVVLGLYNHQYYVDLGTENANESEFPKDTALVRVLKNRWRGDARISGARLKFIGGSGFYELDTRTIDLKQFSMGDE